MSKRHSERMKERWKNPEYRKKMMGHIRRIHGCEQSDGCPHCGALDGYTGTSLHLYEEHYDPNGKWKDSDFNAVIRDCRIVECNACGKKMKLSTVRRKNEQ